MRLILTTIALLLVKYLHAHQVDSIRYVQSGKGVSLHPQPKATAKALANVPYGKTVIIKNDSTPGWAKVRYNNQNGYVAIGSLSRYPALLKNESINLRSEMLAHYLDECFHKKTYNHLPDDKYIVTYENDITLEATVPGITLNIKLAVPGSVMTLRELYLLTRSLYPEFFINSPCPSYSNQVNCLSDGSRLLLYTKGNNHILEWGTED